MHNLINRIETIYLDIKSRFLNNIVDTVDKYMTFKFIEICRGSTSGSIIDI